MKLRTSEYFLQEVFHSLKRNNWMTFASVGTVAVSLFVLGVFLILVMNMNRMAGMLESQVQISVYLQDELKDGRREMLQDEMIVSKISRINRELSHPEDKLPLVSVSVGAAYGGDAEDWTELFNHADTAMYQVKQGGGRGCRFYRP